MKTTEVPQPALDEHHGSVRRSIDPGTDILEPTPGGLTDRIGTSFRSHRPFTVGVVLWLLGYVAAAAVIVGFGLLLTHVLLNGALGRWDTSASWWFVARRTPTLDAITRVGSEIGSTIPIIGVAVLAAIVLAVGRHWRQIGLLAYGLTLEFAGFLTATVFVNRPRPDVPRLDASPPTSSYPSGHTAAAIVLYIGIALVTSSLVRSRTIRVVTWLVALAVPVFVALSRLYRGMHHVTDVAGSVVLGVLVLLFAVLTIRAATTTSRLRDDEAERRALMTSSAGSAP